jgi:hypothetical protein
MIFLFLFSNWEMWVGGSRPKLEIPIRLIFLKPSLTLIFLGVEYRTHKGKPALTPDEGRAEVPTTGWPSRWLGFGPSILWVLCALFLLLAWLARFEEIFHIHVINYFLICAGFNCRSRKTRYAN